MQEKKTITLMLDYMEGPIWLAEADNLYTGIPVLDTDPVLLKLNMRIQRMYSSCYEFNTHEQGCRFDEEQYSAAKAEMRALLTQLIDRLNALNDGSYVIDDKVTEELRNLCK